MEYSYYPVCSLGIPIKSNCESVRFVSKALGQDLPEIENSGCCGAIHCRAAKETISFLTLSSTKASGLALDGKSQEFGLEYNRILFQLKERSLESIR